MACIGPLKGDAYRRTLRNTERSPAWPGRRLYRRDEKEQIVKDRDNLQDALRCLVNGISNMRTKPVKLAPPWPEYGGNSGWME